MMPGPRPSILGGTFALLLAGGCAGEPFAPPAACGECPLPATVPPKVSFIVPSPGGTVNETTSLTAVATDDRKVAGVQFYYSWIKLHPYTIDAGPYQRVLGQYFHGFPICPADILLEVVARDVEGNADTAQVAAHFVPVVQDSTCP